MLKKEVLLDGHEPFQNLPFYSESSYHNRDDFIQVLSTPCTPLQGALYLGCDVGAVRALIESYREAATVPDPVGKLPLVLALDRKASVGVVQAILGAYPEVPSTPMHSSTSLMEHHPSMS